jgi:hypothetical protein
MPIQTPNDELRRRLFLAAQSHMSPQQIQEHDEAAVEYVVDDMERETDEMISKGLSIFRKASHEQRWQAFMTQTDLHDVMTLLSDEPFDLIQAGVVPPPRPVIQVLPDGTVQQSNMWVAAYAAGEDFFEAWAAEFKTMFRRHAQEQMTGANAQPALPPPG